MNRSRHENKKKVDLIKKPPFLERISIYKLNKYVDIQVGIASQEIFQLLNLLNTYSIPIHLPEQSIQCNKYNYYCIGYNI